MGPRVLIVEDQTPVAEQINDFLEWIGCRIIGRVKDGSEAVSAYNDLSPDLVTMDLVMPGMNGVEATKSIVSNHSEAKVLIFTSLDVGDNGEEENEMVTKALEAGAVGAVCKFSKDGILKELKRLFPDELDL